MKYFIFELRLIFQFKQLERRNLKKSGLQRDLNPSLLCDTGAMLYQLSYVWSLTLGARSIYWVHISREEWNYVKCIWNNSYLNCGCWWKWRMIIPVNFQYKQLERRSLKKIGLQRDSNPWPLRNTAGCNQCNQCSCYEATHSHSSLFPQVYKSVKNNRKQMVLEPLKILTYLSRCTLKCFGN